jgi:hypothetical protein
MADYILHKDAYVTCPHVTGVAQAIAPDARVSVSGMAVMTVLRTYSIGGCPRNTPCTAATLTSGAQRVFASGFAVATDASNSLCAPTGGSLAPKVVQRRVTAS